MLALQRTRSDVGEVVMRLEDLVVCDTLFVLADS